MLFEVRRDFTRFDESGVDLTNPWLMWGIYLAHRRGEAHGWSRRVRYAVRRGLTIVLSHHAAGDRIRCSELFPAMRARDIGTDRVAEVLQEMGVLHDDRHPAFENWLHRKLDGLAFGIRGDVESWLRTMRDGGPRSRPRDLGSVQNYMNHVRPVLLEWSARYDHLREVTREDILAILTVLHGSHRNNALVGLRRLFTFCRKTRVVFRDPTRGIKVGEHPSGIVQPLDQIEVEQAVDTATTPVARLVLVLAAVHAARKGAIIHLATVFGLDPKTAIRYAENARTLLVTTAEEQEPTGSREPKDRNDP